MTNLKMKKLLLVEDDPIFRRRFRRELAKSFEVHEATNLQETIDLLKSHQYDYILSDMHLTRENKAEGLEVVACCKAVQTNAVVKAMSSDIDLKQKAIHAGAESFHEKPFDIRLIAF
ncbi:MAG: response regulator [Pseudobacteriovorax sp.]|nr:response regulator [Pseudobacteriovorax sp.]